MKFEYKIEGGDFFAAGRASSAVKKTLKELSVDPAIIRRTVVVLYEGEVNIVAHAYRGQIFIEINREGIKMKLVDEGPGIADVELAMTKGYSTATPAVREMGFGAGMGLPNIKENADAFCIETEIGKGTTLLIEINF